MARIKIKDLPREQKVTQEEIRRIWGGAAYIKFEGVEGEAQDKDHKGWSDLLSFGVPLPR